MDATGNRVLVPLPHVESKTARVADTTTMLSKAVPSLAVHGHTSKVTVSRFNYAFVTHAKTKSPPPGMKWMPLSVAKSSAALLGGRSHDALCVVYPRIEGGSIAKKPHNAALAVETSTKQLAATWEEYTPEGHRVSASSLRLDTIE